MAAAHRASSGELVVDRTTLEIRDAKAHLGGVDWSGVQGRIAELGDHARLDIEGTARGPLAEMLRFVNATPVGRWTGRRSPRATGTGPADLKLGLGAAARRTPADSDGQGQRWSSPATTFA